MPLPMQPHLETLDLPYPHKRPFVCFSFLHPFIINRIIYLCSQQSGAGSSESSPTPPPPCPPASPPTPPPGVYLLQLTNRHGHFTLLSPRSLGGRGRSGWAQVHGFCQMCRDMYLTCSPGSSCTWTGLLGVRGITVPQRPPCCSDSASLCPCARELADGSWLQSRYRGLSLV